MCEHTVCPCSGRTLQGGLSSRCSRSIGHGENGLGHSTSPSNAGESRQNCSVEQNERQKACHGGRSDRQTNCGTYIVSNGNKLGAKSLLKAKALAKPPALYVAVWSVYHGHQYLDRADGGATISCVDDSGCVDESGIGGARSIAACCWVGDEGATTACCTGEEERATGCCRADGVTTAELAPVGAGAIGANVASLD
jgi:hypothetical protein